MRKFEKEGENMEQIEIMKKTGMMFWLEGSILFGKIISTGLVFCCGEKPLTTTTKDVSSLLESAWIW